MTRLIVLLRRPPEIEPMAFAAEVLGAVGRPLARLAEVPWVAVYVPEEGLLSVKLPFLASTTFHAVVEVGVEGASPESVLVAALASLPHAAYRVEERRLKTYPRVWADGEPSPGLFLVSAVRRASSCTDARAFDAHWRDRHARLALEHHVGMWDYRQSVVHKRLSLDCPPFDGIARLGFPTVHDFETGLFDSREGRRALGEDTARFVDIERTENALLRETVLKS